MVRIRCRYSNRIDIDNVVIYLNEILGSKKLNRGTDR